MSTYSIWGTGGTSAMILKLYKSQWLRKYNFTVTELILIYLKPCQIIFIPLSLSFNMSQFHFCVYSFASWEYSVLSTQVTDL